MIVFLSPSLSISPLSFLFLSLSLSLCLFMYLLLAYLFPSPYSFVSICSFLSISLSLSLSLTFSLSLSPSRYHTQTCDTQTEVIQPYRLTWMIFGKWNISPTPFQLFFLNKKNAIVQKNCVARTRSPLKNAWLLNANKSTAPDCVPGCRHDTHCCAITLIEGAAMILRPRSGFMRFGEPLANIKVWLSNELQATNRFPSLQWKKNWRGVREKITLKIWGATFQACFVLHWTLCKFGGSCKTFRGSFGHFGG